MFIGGFLITLVVKRLNKFVSVKVRVVLVVLWCLLALLPFLYLCLSVFVPVDYTVCRNGLGLGRNVSKELTHTYITPYKFWSKAKSVQFDLIINISNCPKSYLFF